MASLARAYITTRYPRALITIMEILVPGVPRSIARCEMANNPNASAMYRANMSFFALKTQRPKITIISAKTKFNKTVGSIAISNSPPYIK